MTLQQKIEKITTKTALERIKEDNKPEEQIQIKTRTLNQFKNIFSVWIEPTRDEFLSSMEHFIPKEEKTKQWIHEKTLTTKGEYKNKFTYQGPFLSKYYIGGSIVYDNLPKIEMIVRYGYETVNNKKQPQKEPMKEEIKYVAKPTIKDKLKQFIKGTKTFLLYIAPLTIISNIDSCNTTLKQIKHLESVAKTEELQQKKYEIGYKTVQITHQIGTKQGESWAYKMMKEEYP